MQLLGLIDFSTFILYNEVYLQGCQKLFRAHAIEIFYHTVVIKDG